MNDEGLSLDPDRCVLIVQDLQNNADPDNFNSREAATNRPQLVVVTQ